MAADSSPTQSPQSASPDTAPPPDAVSPDQPQARLPILYGTVEALDAQTHTGLGIKSAEDFSFTRAAHYVPLTASEVGLAAAFYPIVFVGDPPLPLAVLGLREGENLFVDAENRWMAGAYLPGYIRRYPFILIGNAEDPRLTVGIDRSTGFITEGTDRPLFTAEGKATDTLQQAMDYCQQYQRDYAATMKACRLLNEQGLFVDNEAKFTLRDGTEGGLRGLKLIDRKKVEEAPDDQLIGWRSAGLLPVIYAHMISQSHWHRLVAMENERRG